MHIAFLTLFEGVGSIYMHIAFLNLFEGLGSIVSMDDLEDNLRNDRFNLHG